MKTPSKRDQVLALAQSRAVVRPRDMVAEGLPKSYLNLLAKEGALVELGRGLYQWPQREASNHESLLEATQVVPNGVVTLLSALSFHGIGTQNPFEVWLAIDRKSRKPKVEYPPVRFVTISHKVLIEGVEHHQVDGVSIPIYSAAKTVADCFKFRNKIGLDVALEALKDGWQNKKFTMDELQHFATLCRVHNVIRPYMQTLE